MFKKSELNWSAVMYKGWNDAMVQTHDLFSAWMLLPREERRTAGYWHLYLYDKVYRTEEKRKFYFDDVWNRENKDPPPLREGTTNTYYDRVYLLLSPYHQK